MDIPYDLIHELEIQYGSISLVPESNSTLKEIRTTLHAKHKEVKYDFSEYKKEQIISYIEDGYNITETAYLARVSGRRVRNTIEQNNLIVKPRFKYVAIKDGVGIFSSGTEQYRFICRRSCNTFSYAKRYLHEKGYQLEKAESYYHWCDIKPNEQYIIDYGIYTK